jgi:hypothetical protein
MAREPMIANPREVFRGVDALHPTLSRAKRGEIVPGNIHGAITPEEHNRGDVSHLSPYTSWTFDRELAKVRARWNGPGGVLLTLEMSSPEAGDTWSWVESPDNYDEQEILLRGPRTGATVELL